MPKNRRKSGKRKRLRQFFGKCTSPETRSPDIDNATQNCHSPDIDNATQNCHSPDIDNASQKCHSPDIDDAAQNCYSPDTQKCHSPDIDNASQKCHRLDIDNATQNCYSPDIDNASQKCHSPDIDDATQNCYSPDTQKCHSPDIDNATQKCHRPDIDNATQNCYSPDTQNCHSPDIDNASQNCKDVEHISTIKSYSGEYIKNIPEYNSDVAEQNRSHGYITITPQQKVSAGKNEYNSNGYDKNIVEHRPFDVAQRRTTSGFGEMEITSREDDSTTIGACSRSPVGIDERMGTTANKEDGNISIGACSPSPVGIDITANKEDDNTSIGACSLSDAEEQIIEKHSAMSDDGENSNDSRKQKDVDFTANPSPKTGLYIDPMVLDSQKEIILNMKTLIEQNLKKIKDMRKQKAHLNITVQKAELKVDRAKKSNDEMNLKITSLKTDFWKEAKKFPAIVSLKRDKFDNLKPKNKQDLVELLNTMKRKENLLKEVIPKLTKENALTRSWGLTVPAVILSPLIEQLNVQFEAEFGTRFEIKELKPGIYFKHPFKRITHYIPEEKVEEFKIKQPYLYYNCQCFIKGNDARKIDQQNEEVNLYDEKKLYQEESKEKDSDKQPFDFDNNLNKRKTSSNGTSLIMKRYDVTKTKNKQENTMADDLQTKMSTYSADKIVRTKNQTPIRNTRKPIVESKVKIDKAKIQMMINSTPRRSSDGDKIRTSRCSEEIAVNNNEKRKMDQKNIKVDKTILERVEKLREQGKDVYIKTTGDKSFIYIKHAVSQVTATGSDLIRNKNGNVATSVTKRSKPKTDIMVVQRPPSAPITYAARKSIPTTYNSNSKTISRWLNVNTKPVAVKGKTKIPLYIRPNMANKTPTPRRQPISNVPQPHIHLEEKRSNHGVIQRKGKLCGSDSTVTDVLKNEAIVDLDKYNMDQEIPSPKESTAKNVQMSLKTPSKPPKVYQKSLKSLIPISVRYMKERDQSRGASTKPTPYNYIINKLINEYFPLDIEENNAFDNPEDIENKPGNNHHSMIPIKENEKLKTKGKIKTKDKVENRKSLFVQESDNVILKKPRNIVLLPSIKPASSPTNRARTRTERCKSNKTNNIDHCNNDSLCANGSTLNVRNSVSVTVPQKSAADARLSGKLLKKTNCNFLPSRQGKKVEKYEMVPHPPESPKTRLSGKFKTANCNLLTRLQESRDEKNEMVPHPPKSPKDGSNRSIRRNVRTPKSIKMGSNYSKFSNDTDGQSV